MSRLPRFGIPVRLPPKDPSLPTQAITFTHGERHAD